MASSYIRPTIMKTTPFFSISAWTACFTLLLALGCSSPEPTQAPDPKPQAPNPPKTTAAPKPDSIPRKPEASLCEFSKLYSQIQYEYDQITVDRRPKNPAPLNTGFDFVHWKPAANMKLPGSVKKAYWNKETQDYFRFEHFGGRENDLELYVVQENGYKLIFPHQPNVYDSPDSTRRPVTGRWSRVSAIPDVPGCFIQIPKTQYIYYVVGSDDDGTIFEPPFEYISQAISIYLCDGSLNPRYRIGFFGGKSSFVAKYQKRGAEITETFCKIAKGAKVELDSICLQKLDQLPAKATVDGSESPETHDAVMPQWLEGFGVMKRTPQFTHSNNRIVK